MSAEANTRAESDAVAWVKRMMLDLHPNTRAEDWDVTIFPDPVDREKFKYTVKWRASVSASDFRL